MTLEDVDDMEKLMYPDTEVNYKELKNNIAIIGYQVRPTELMKSSYKGIRAFTIVGESFVRFEFRQFDSDTCNLYENMLNCFDRIKIEELKK
jgi:hypothetical protein